jgi:hypothetical protein
MRDAEIVDNPSAEAVDARLLGLSERAPADVERQVLAVSVASSLDQLCAALDASEWLLARARTIDCLMKQIAIAWIDRNGEFSIGQVRYWVQYPLTVRCLNVAQTGHAVLEAAGGDFDHFLEILVAQPYRHAAVRSIVGKALHGRLFSAHRSGRLANGVPQRVLKRADATFLPARDDGPDDKPLLEDRS